MYVCNYVLSMYVEFVFFVYSIVGGVGVEGVGDV